MTTANVHLKQTPFQCRRTTPASSVHLTQTPLQYSGTRKCASDTNTIAMSWYRISTDTNNTIG